MGGLLVNESSIKIDEGEGLITKTVYAGKKWRVWFEATEWFAIAYHSTTFEKDDFVRVVGRVDATTLVIEPQ
jgi:hypothetical protein